MELKQLGNIYSSNGEFATKAAILQSFYRASINEKCGLGRKNIVTGTKEDGKPILKSISQEYGHLVKGGDLRNINFYYNETFEYAKCRVNNKNPDETIKADRLFNNLLSSMPMAFNLFHPLIMIGKKYPKSLNRMIKSIFPTLPIDKVNEVLIEFIPRPVSTYIEDKSAMDASITYSDEADRKYLIAIETKYIDQLGKNKAKKKDLKLKTARELNMFTEEGIKEISGGCTQIYRNFLLTEKYRLVHGLCDSYSIILAPGDHPSTETEIASLHKNLLPEFHYKLQKYALEDFVDKLKFDCPEEFKPWLAWFYDRYLNFSKTEHLFREFTNQ
jgi:hypothetical protein